MSAFWRELSLQEMSSEQWESLCDGCAKCCLHKLQDEDTDEVYYTNVACQLLDETSCRCQDYLHRVQRVPECLSLSAKNISEVSWLPKTCAYRLVYEGKDLPNWHPLVSGNANSVHAAGVSVKGKIVREENVDEDAMEDHIVYWVDDIL